MPDLNSTFRRWTLLIFLSIVTAAVGFTTPAQSQGDDPLKMLTMSTAMESVRLDAAATLLRQELSSKTIRKLVQILSPTPQDPVAQRLLLVAIAARPITPPEFEEPIIELVARGETQIRPQALAALASVGTWDAARVLIDHAAPYMAPEVSSAANAALIRMTGRDDLAGNIEGWRAWLAERKDLDEDQWRAELLRGLTDRIDRLSVREAEATTMAVDGFRRLFLVAPYQDRGPLLAELLLSTDSLRELGIELVYRDLAQGRQIDPAVGEAALTLLAESDPKVRAEAAKLVNTLSPENSESPVTQALVNETSPDAAAALLTAAARWPNASVVKPALRWLEFGAATRDAASTLLLALDTAGLLTSPADRRRVASALRAAGPERLTPDGVRLIIRTGTDDDREAVTVLLNTGTSDQRAAASSELARRPEFFDRVIAAAERDPGLYGSAVAAAIAHRHGADGYALIRRLDAPSDDARRAGLLAVARSLPPRFVLEAARQYETDPEMRAAILSTIGNAAANEAEQRDIDQAMILLAETYLRLANPENSLNALASISAEPAPDDASKIAEIKTISLLWLNRIDEAIDAGAGVDAWFTALDRIGAEPHAEVVAQRALARFGNVLSESERLRLNSIANVAQTPPTEPKPNEGG